ncbi:MAG: hypothetical protein GX577_10365 [Leptolinea sp.]|nr:hypothetical protein [Leptolinea sp.]
MTQLDKDQINQSNFRNSAAEDIPSQPNRQTKRDIRVGLILTLLGYLIFLLGARPSIYGQGLDRSSVVGFVQIAVFLLGIGIISIGAYISIKSLWHGEPGTIMYQIGMRLVQTGFVIALFTGMADVFGLGSHPLPNPFFGPLQSIGVQIGEFFIGLGILMMFPFHRLVDFKPRRPSEVQSAGNNTNYE